MVFNLEEVLDRKYKHALDNARGIGIDIGSRGSKAVLLYNGKLYTEIQPSGISTKDTAIELYESVLRQANIDKDEITHLVGTGYGNIAMEFEGAEYEPITEISCHAMGAHYLHAATETVVDIGGQDSKAIRINPHNGKVTDFVMNDKCAAGTGRFLEKVGQILEIGLDDLGSTAVRSENPSKISSQCVVFAESEVISLRATGTPKEDIAYGIHLASANRVASLLKRTGFKKDILFTGGVSNNIGMRKALEEILGVKLSKTTLDTVYAGALGAAIIASENAAISLSERDGEAG